MIVSLPTPDGPDDDDEHRPRGARRPRSPAGTGPPTSGRLGRTQAGEARLELRRELARHPDQVAAGWAS